MLTTSSAAAAMKLARPTTGRIASLAMLTAAYVKLALPALLCVLVVFQAF
jgi:hypothetical protein